MRLRCLASLLLFASISAAVAADWEPVAASGPGHYVVCLECGKKFGYDWSEMRIIK